MGCSSTVVVFGEPSVKCGAFECPDCNDLLEIALDAVCFHVGYLKGHASAEDALTLATRKLRELIERMPAGPRLLLENSCEGGELGQSIAELGRLLRDVDAPAERFGLLIDTCHLHAAGFDLAGEDAGQRLADALAAAGVLERVVAFHLNDSRTALGSRVDRHAHPGRGELGLAPFRSLLNDRRFADRPMIIEVAGGDIAYRRDLKLLRGLRK